MSVRFVNSIGKKTPITALISFLKQSITMINPVVFRNLENLIFGRFLTKDLKNFVSRRKLNHKKYKYVYALPLAKFDIFKKKLYI